MSGLRPLAAGHLAVLTSGHRTGRRQTTRRCYFIGILTYFKFIFRQLAVLTTCRLIRWIKQDGGWSGMAYIAFP